MWRVLFPAFFPLLLNAQPATLLIDPEPMHAVPSVLTPLNNPALAASNEQVRVGLGQLRGFMLREFDRRFICAIIPWRAQGAIAFTFVDAGMKEFRQRYYSAGYSRKFGENFNAAINGWMYSVAQGEGYGSRNLAGATIGLSGMVARQVRVSTVLDVPAEEDELFYPSAKLRSGISIRCSDHCRIESTALLESGQPLQLVTGINYRPQERFHFRTGVMTQPFGIYMGCGIGLKNWSFDIAAFKHPVSGITPRFMVAFTQAKKKQP